MAEGTDGNRVSAFSVDQSARIVQSLLYAHTEIFGGNVFPQTSVDFRQNSKKNESAYGAKIEKALTGLFTKGQFPIIQGLAASLDLTRNWGHHCY